VQDMQKKYFKEIEKKMIPEKKVIPEKADKVVIN
jgi:hypothetical protein